MTRLLLGNNTRGTSSCNAHVIPDPGGLVIWVGLTRGTFLGICGISKTFFSWVVGAGFGGGIDPLGVAETCGALGDRVLVPVTVSGRMFGGTGSTVGRLLCRRSVLMASTAPRSVGTTCGRRVGASCGRYAVHAAGAFMSGHKPTVLPRLSTGAGGTELRTSSGRSALEARWLRSSCSRISCAKVSCCSLTERS